MSKYNIDEMVYTSLLNYKYTKSELKSPNLIYKLLNKVGKNKRIIDELHAICKVVFTDNCLVFTPSIRRQILRDKSQSKIKYVRNYVKSLLDDLGFETFVYNNNRDCASVYVSLREPKNKQKLQQMGNVFKFKNASPVLTQSVLDSIKQHKR